MVLYVERIFVDNGFCVLSVLSVYWCIYAFVVQGKLFRYFFLSFFLFGYPTFVADAAVRCCYFYSTVCVCVSTCVFLSVYRSAARKKKKKRNGYLFRKKNFFFQLIKHKFKQHRFFNSNNTKIFQLFLPTLVCVLFFFSPLFCLP